MCSGSSTSTEQTSREASRVCEQNGGTQRPRRPHRRKVQEFLCVFCELCVQTSFCSQALKPSRHVVEAHPTRPPSLALYPERASARQARPPEPQTRNRTMSRIRTTR